MSDVGNSRYSIVERLTKNKLEVISDKAKLKQEVESAKNDAESVKTDLENWRQDIKSEVETEDRQRQLRLEKAVRRATNVENSVKDKEAMYDLKLKAIDEALARIEEISKSSQS